MFFSFFKNRKSRKQLLQEIEELQKEVTRQQSFKVETTLELDVIKKQIRTISAACIMQRHCDDYHSVENCLCEQLAKELLPYIYIERYAYTPTDPYFYGETKYIATIKIVE